MEGYQEICQCVGMDNEKNGIHDFADHDAFNLDELLNEDTRKRGGLD